MHSVPMSLQSTIINKYKQNDHINLQFTRVMIWSQSEIGMILGLDPVEDTIILKGKFNVNYLYLNFECTNSL